MKISLDALLRLLITAGLILIVTAISPFRIDPVFSIKDDAFVFVATILIVTGAVHALRYGMALCLPVALYALYALFAMFSISWATNIYEGFKEGYRWVLLAGVIFAAYQVRGAYRMTHFIRAGTCVGAGVALVGILEYFGIELLFSEQGKIISLFGHQNLLGQYLAVVVIWSLCLFVFDNKYRRLSALCLLITIPGLFVTFCRSAWLATVVACITIAGILCYRKKKLNISRTFIVTAAGLVCVAILFVLLTLLRLDSVDKATRAQFKQVSHILATDDFLSGRDIIWSATIDLIRSNPLFGHGIGNHWIVYPSTDPEFVDFSKYAHNDYLHMLSETGLIGFMIFMSAVIIALIRIGRFNPPSALLCVYTALLGAVVVILTDSLFSYGLYMPVPSYIFAVSLGLLLVLIEPPFRQRDRIKRRMIPFIAVGCGCLVALAGFFIFHRTIGFWRYLQASIAISKDPGRIDIPAARSRLDQALRYLPYETEILFFSMMLDMNQGQFPRARATGYRLLELTPYEKKILFMMAKLEAVMGNQGQSQQLYERLNATGDGLDSRYVRYLIEHFDRFDRNLHTSMLEKNSAHALLAELNKTFDKNTASPFTRFTRGTLYLRTRQWPQAAADFSACLESGQKFPLAHLFRGMCNAKLGRFDAASADYRAYLATDSESEVALLGLAIAAQKSGDTAQAEKYLNATLKVNPDNPKALRNMGILLLDRNGKLKAAHYFRRSLEIDPDQPNASAIRSVIDEINEQAD